MNKTMPLKRDNYVKENYYYSSRKSKKLEMMEFFDGI
jgi:hypothetical protein